MGTQETTRWPVVGVSILAGVVAAAHIGKVPTVIPALRGELGLGLVAAGWVVSMFNTLGSACGIVQGMIGDTLGHRRSALVGLLMLAVGGGVGAMSSDQVLLLAGRCIEGVGFISVVVSCPGLILAVTAPRDLRLTFGLLGVYMPTGVAAALALAPFIESALGWRGLWLVLGAVSLGMAVLLAWITRGLPRNAATPGAGTARGIADDLLTTLRQPGLWWLAAAFTAYTIQWSSLLVWLPSVLMETRQTDAVSAAGLTALIAAANAPGGVLGAWLLHRRIPRGQLVIAANAAMGVCCIGIFSPVLSDQMRFGLCLLFSGLGGILPSAVLGGTAVHASGPRQIGAANGMVIQGSNLGQLIGPLTAAGLVSLFGDWDSVRTFLLGAAMLGAVAGLLVERSERRLSYSGAE